MQPPSGLVAGLWSSQGQFALWALTRNPFRVADWVFVSWSFGGACFQIWKPARLYYRAGEVGGRAVLRAPTASDDCRWMHRLPHPKIPRGSLWLQLDCAELPPRKADKDEPESCRMGDHARLSSAHCGSSLGLRSSSTLGKLAGWRLGGGQEAMLVRGRDVHATGPSKSTDHFQCQASSPSRVCMKLSWPE